MESIGPRRREDLRTRQLGGEAIVLDRRQNQVHQLNSTARFVWTRLDGRMSVEGIADELIAEFGIDRETAERDLAQVLRQLAELGLLEMAPSVV